jgi:acetyl-CoA synthetase
VTAEKLYTVEEAAAEIKISPQTMAKWLRAGKIRGVRVGRLWRVPESALDEIAQGGTKKPEDSGDG